MKERTANVSAPVGLQPRRSPRQDRAKQTVKKILDATAELLEQEGAENLTTDRVADRCGINIATLYHYYPNKEALLHALALQFADQQQEQLDAIYNLRGEIAWCEILDRVVDAAIEFNRTVTGAMAVSRAMQIHSKLREIDYERDSQASKFVATLLAELGIEGSTRELQLRALVLIQTVGSAVDKALMWYPEDADAAMYEVKLMMKIYVEYYIEQSRITSSAAHERARRADKPSKSSHYPLDVSAPTREKRQKSEVSQRR